MIKRIIDIFANKLLFTCVLIVTFLLDTILLIHDYTGPLLKLFIVWGTLIIIWDFFYRKQLWNTKNLKWLIFFGASYLITTLINSRSYLGDNLKILAYMMIFFIVLYGHNQAKTMEKWKKQIRTIMLVYFWTATILAIICFITFLFSINHEILTRDGYMHTGMYDNRLWGLYNPNAGACINVVAIFFAIGIGTSLEKKYLYKKIVLAIASIIHYMCLLLTSSRAALYSFVLGAGILFFLFLNTRSKTALTKSKKVILKNVLLAVTVIVALYGVESPIKQVVSYIPGCIKMVCSGEDKAEEIEKVELTRKEELENRDGGILTGRAYLWKAGLKALEQSPLFGISKAATYDYSKEYIEDPQWLEHLEVSLHSVYITVLVASGWIGFVLFVIFLLKNILPMIRVALFHNNDDNYMIYASCIVVVACLLIIELVEARIIYRTEVFNVIFWAICGFAYNYVEIINILDDKGEVNGAS